MTKHNFRLLDIYTDYLLSSFGATTATGLSRLLPELSHDQITRMLSQKPLTDRDLWKIVKPLVRQVQSKEAVLIIDDTVEQKPYNLIPMRANSSLGIMTTHKAAPSKVSICSRRSI